MRAKLVFVDRIVKGKGRVAEVRRRPWPASEPLLHLRWLAAFLESLDRRLIHNGIPGLFLLTWFWLNWIESFCCVGEHVLPFCVSLTSIAWYLEISLRFNQCVFPGYMYFRILVSFLQMLFFVWTLFVWLIILDFDFCCYCSLCVSRLTIWLMNPFGVPPGGWGVLMSSDGLVSLLALQSCVT